MSRMEEIDRKIKKINEELDEISIILRERTKVEDKAIELIGKCKFDEAMELLKTLDDDVIEERLDKNKPGDTVVLDNEIPIVGKSR